MAKTKTAAKSNVPSDSNQPYTVFLSHKEKYESEFRKIADALEASYGPLVEVFIAERMSSGTKWFEKIMTQIRRSDVFILVYTDPKLGWDFPMFEAGVRLGFDWKDSTTPKPNLVIIHHDLTLVPTPFKNMQCVEVSEESPYRLDDYLLSLHKRISGQSRKLKTLEQTGKDKEFHLRVIREIILTMLTDGTEQQLIYPPEIQVRFPKELDIHKSTVRVNTTFATLTGAKNVECSWSDFIKRLSGRCKFSDGWKECLLDAVERSTAYNDPSYPLPLLRLKRDGNTTELRPNVTSVVADKKGFVTVNLTFTCMPPTSNAEGTDHLHQIIEFLEGAKGLRFGAINAILLRCDELETEGDISLERVLELAKRGHLALTSILEEAYGSGYKRAELLVALHKYGQSQDLESIFERWDTGRSEFRDASNLGQNVDPATLLRRFKELALELDELNREFTKRAARALEAYFDDDSATGRPMPQKGLLQFLGFK